MLLKRLIQQRTYHYNWLWLVPLVVWPLSLWLLFNGGSFFEAIRNSDRHSALISPVPSTNSQFKPGIGGGPELTPTPTVVLY